MIPIVTDNAMTSVSKNIVGSRADVSKPKLEYIPFVKQRRFAFSQDFWL